MPAGPALAGLGPAKPGPAKPEPALRRRVQRRAKLVKRVGLSDYVSRLLTWAKDAAASASKFIRAPLHKSFQKQTTLPQTTANTLALSYQRRQGNPKRSRVKTQHPRS